MIGIHWAFAKSARDEECSPRLQTILPPNDALIVLSGCILTTLSLPSISNLRLPGRGETNDLLVTTDSARPYTSTALETGRSSCFHISATRARI